MTLDSDIADALEGARVWAIQGAAPEMETLLASAQRYAITGGRDISKQVERIAKLGYRNAIPVTLADARRRAKEEDASLMESALEEAQRYAILARRDISAVVADIRAIPYGER